MKFTALFAFLLPSLAFASITDQEILLAPPTAPSSMAQAEGPGFFAYGHRVSFGIGSGVNIFGGNAGRIYGSSAPLVELRGEWAFMPAWSVRLGADLANYSFNAAPNGAVDTSTRTLRISSQAHFLSTALVGEGFDPYLALNAEWLSRKQTFQAVNMAESDSAFGLGAGLGSNLLLEGGRFAFWAEAGASKVFFQDRFSTEYAASGVSDLGGLLYTGRLGVKYYF